MHNLPLDFRPGGYVKPLSPGLDLPCWFIDGIKGVNENFHFVFHPYKLLWESIINKDSGELEDPRYTIHKEPHLYGEQELWGWVLTDGKGRPLENNNWHIWELCRPHGWGHVLELQSTDKEYLKFALDRLYLQYMITEKYGRLAWNHYLQEEEKLLKQKAERAQAQQDADIDNENKGLWRHAYENFQRGHVAPTNPTKDVIVSYRGQKNRTKIERPIKNKEGGFVGLGD